MRELVEFLRVYDAYFLLGLSVICLILLIWALCVSRKLGRICQRRYARLEDGRVGEIVDCLDKHFEAISSLSERMTAAEGKQADQAASLAECLNGIGIVRFDAFDDVGGEQSFALALLDDRNRGIVVSSIYGRQDSRLYAKEIVDGNGDRALSDEEQRALEKARG